MIEPMDVHIVLMDGTKAGFHVTEPKSLFQFFDRPKAPDLFSTTFFAVENSHRVAVFPTQQIATIDFATTRSIPWKMPTGTEDGVLGEVTREDLIAALRPENWKQFDREKAFAKDGTFEGFVQMSLAGGTRRIVKIRTTRPPSMQQRMLLEPLLKRPMFFFPRVGGGLCFVHTAAVRRLDLLPGMPEIAPGALTGIEISNKSEGREA